MYLVDANVLSETTRSRPNEKVIDWLTLNERRIVIDSIILGEIQVGILSLPKGRKRRSLEAWFRNVVRSVECLPWDSAISLRWSELVVDLRRRGEIVPVLDSMIAATALVHDLTISTRNVRHFSRTGVRVLDPFA
jgi:predicted nucleic acid-binding protein